MYKLSGNLSLLSSELRILLCGAARQTGCGTPENSQLLVCVWRHAVVLASSHKKQPRVGNRVFTRENYIATYKIIDNLKFYKLFYSEFNIKPHLIFINLYRSPNIVRVMKSRSLRSAGHVALVGRYLPKSLFPFQINTNLFFSPSPYNIPHHLPLFLMLMIY